MPGRKPQVGDIARVALATYDNLRSEMPGRKPQVGDIAHHKGGLDPRRVVRVGRAVPADYSHNPVDRERLCVGLQIGTVEAWPCPASNYTFTRTRDGA